MVAKHSSCRGPRAVQQHFSVCEGQYVRTTAHNNLKFIFAFAVLYMLHEFFRLSCTAHRGACIEVSIPKATHLMSCDHARSSLRLPMVHQAELGVCVPAAVIVYP